MLDLHTHLGGAVPASVLWEILCDSGLQTDFETFDQLQDFLTVGAGDVKNLDDFLGLYFHSTELIQSSPQAASIAVYQAVAKAYRRAKISGIEIRYNPLKRVREGLHTLDAIILASVQGMQRASMHYKVRTGLLFSMAKELTLEQNTEIVNAAMRFCKHGVVQGAYGVVGLDMAGPESLGHDKDDAWLDDYAKLIERAKGAGLGVTWHVGETMHSGPEGMLKVLERIQPDRIGHGIQCGHAEGKTADKLFDILRERRVCLEICPSVNVVTKSVETYETLAKYVQRIDAEGVPFCINTDNPYIIHTNLEKEFQMLEKFLPEDFRLREKSHKHAEESTFMKIQRKKTLKERE